MRKQTTLAKWLKSRKRLEVANQLKVHATTIDKWSNGLVLPKSEQMLAIWRLTNGGLTPNKMIQEYFSNKDNSQKYSK